MKICIQLVLVYLLMCCLSCSPESRSKEDNMEHSEHIKSQNTNVIQYTTSKATYVLPKISLTNRHNGVVNFQEVMDYQGPIALQFIYTSCPTICPVMSDIFTKAQALQGPQ